MLLLRHTIMKKILASALLMLVVFIYGVKCFHHHPSQKANIACHVSAQCPVCEFEFAHDAITVTPGEIITPFYFHAVLFNTQLPSHIINLTYPAESRGPPVIT